MGDHRVTAPREVRRTVRIADPDGLHARPCAQVARAVERFRCSVRVVHGGSSADARSVLELLGLGVLAAAEVEILATGDDAEACAAAVARVLGQPSLR